LRARCAASSSATTWGSGHRPVAGARLERHELPAVVELPVDADGPSEEVDVGDLEAEQLAGSQAGPRSRDRDRLPVRRQDSADAAHQADVGHDEHLVVRRRQGDADARGRDHSVEGSGPKDRPQRRARHSDGPGRQVVGQASTSACTSVVRTAAMGRAPIRGTRWTRSVASTRRAVFGRHGCEAAHAVAYASNVTLPARGSTY
jgi:hypothetical protein